MMSSKKQTNMRCQGRKKSSVMPAPCAWQPSHIVWASALLAGVGKLVAVIFAVLKLCDVEVPGTQCEYHWKSQLSGLPGGNPFMIFTAAAYFLSMAWPFALAT